MSKSTYPLKLPLSIKKAAQRLAKEDGVSSNQWIAVAVAERLGWWKPTADFFKKRAGKGTGGFHTSSSSLYAGAQPVTKATRTSLCLRMGFGTLQGLRPMLRNAAAAPRAYLKHPRKGVQNGFRKQDQVAKLQTPVRVVAVAWCGSADHGLWLCPGIRKEPRGDNLLAPGIGEAAGRERRQEVQDA